MSDLTGLPEWTALAAHRDEVSGVHLRDLFAEDPGRGEATDASMPAACTSTTRRTGSPPRRCGCSSRWPRPAGCGPGPTRCSPASTSTSPRTAPVLHVALRAPADATILVDGENVVPEVHAVLAHARLRRRACVRGTWSGHTGQPHPDRRQHRHRRLRPRAGDGLRGADAVRHARARRSASSPTSTAPTSSRHLRDLDPARDAVHRRSKTFTTLETMTNARVGPGVAARTARRRGRGGAALRRGLDERRRRSPSSASTPTNMFEFWDWVGGRYSLTSAIGLSLMIAIGPERFREMLAGFHAMDEHFRTAPFDAEPARCCSACSASGTTNFLGAETLAILPYDQYLGALPRLPAAARHGEQRQVGHARRRAGRLPRHGPIVWGEPGTNGQHAFYQLHPPGHAAGPVRLHRLRARRTTRSATTTTC